MFILHCCDLISHFMALRQDTPKEALLESFTEGVGLTMEAHSYRIGESGGRALSVSNGTIIEMLPVNQNPKDL